jgi:hypothetical protein
MYVETVFYMFCMLYGAKKAAVKQSQHWAWVQFLLWSNVMQIEFLFNCYTKPTFVESHSYYRSRCLQPDWLIHDCKDLRWKQCIDICTKDAWIGVENGWFSKYTQNNVRQGGENGKLYKICYCYTKILKQTFQEISSLAIRKLVSFAYMYLCDRAPKLCNNKYELPK